MSGQPSAPGQPVAPPVDYTRINYKLNMEGHPLFGGGGIAASQPQQPPQPTQLTTPAPPLAPTQLAISSPPPAQPYPPPAHHAPPAPIPVPTFTPPSAQLMQTLNLKPEQVPWAFNQAPSGAPPPNLPPPSALPAPPSPVPLPVSASAPAPIPPPTLPPHSLYAPPALPPPPSLALATPAYYPPPAVPPPAQPSTSSTYTIQAGDTFWKVSQTFGVPLQQLLAMNPGRDPHSLQVGSTITVPASHGRPPPPSYAPPSLPPHSNYPAPSFPPPPGLAHAPYPSPSYPPPPGLGTGTAPSPAAYSPPSYPPPPGAGAPGAHAQAQYHTIRPGDTYWALSQQYRTTVQALEALNPGVNYNCLQVGAAVRIR
ncbi:carbohydrate-binding module family 50 protein [Gonapodya prolifera JEL478]|uniref:Carbohydrate-binding module family 50 protein n=1 Tax=Gonapodya prolifera (strain JEL478) TaxID=1344416 RepID=A0A139AH04_GONPJ|nr:carbohydrate-binding module family 50 protein [Gonapodya prolifera JEL478]|eukprot:KXS15725.1 carbohydrate-binding module family 50 protein [Gonapodya prolifera JEL478]